MTQGRGLRQRQEESRLRSEGPYYLDMKRDEGRNSKVKWKSGKERHRHGNVGACIYTRSRKEKTGGKGSKARLYSATKVDRNRSTEVLNQSAVPRNLMLSGSK